MTPGAAPGVVRVKPGVLFTTIAPAGFLILAAITRAARELHVDLTITSACDGLHDGPDDPHYRGEAYDVRAHGYSELLKDAILSRILTALVVAPLGPPTPVPGIARSLVTSAFFGFLEAAGTPDEHFHVQLRKGRSYP